MDAEQIQQLVTAELPDCELSVEGGDGKYLISVTGDVFADLNAVKRQQLIYKIINPHIASGAIHAVSMDLKTVAERQA